MEDIVGQKIKEVRPMTKAELDLEYWDRTNNVTVIVLEDGTKLFPSKDAEGNAPGAILGIDSNNNCFGLK